MPSCPSIDLSVIIVTRNTRDLVCDAVRSIQECAEGLATETIVVDNASTDDTADVLQREFPQVKYLRSEKNLGFARANNLGAAESRGEFLLLMNSDARATPGSLSASVRWMREHPDCGVVGGQLLNPDGSRQNSIASFPTLATELLNKSLLRRLWPEKFPGKETVFAKPHDVDTVLGAFMLIRRPLWEAIGGLDERYFFFFEETDFCFQTRRRGQRVVHLPEVRIWHGQGQTAKQIPVGVRIEYWRSRYAYFTKNYSTPTRAILRAGLLLRLGFEWITALLLVVLTLSQSAHWRSRLRVCSALLNWHLRGCPDSAGLPK